MSYHTSIPRTNSAAAAQGGDIPTTYHPQNPRAALQHALGNQAVQRLARGGTGELVVHPPNDVHEQEADRIADRATADTDRAGEVGLGANEITPTRTGASVQRAASGGAASISPEISGARGAAPAGSGGQPLDGRTRAAMESRIGFDFSGVRVHTGERAAASADALAARAYTAGSDIVFARGAYAPETREGSRLLAHELTHVAQQREGIARQPASSSATAAPTGQSAQKCPSNDERKKILADAKAQDETILSMELRKWKATNNAANGPKVNFSKSLLQQADDAIHRQFSDQIGKGRTFAQTFASPSKKPEDSSVRALSPADFAKELISSDEIAVNFIARAAMHALPAVMSAACITSAKDSVLLDEVARPILATKKIGWVRDFIASQEGGFTWFENEEKDDSSVHSMFQNTNRNLGAVIVHEALHFYVGAGFRTGTLARSDHRRLMEGGAEYLARVVIWNQLSANPDFAINYETYAADVDYVTSMGPGRLSVFPTIYFQGRVDLLPPVS